MNKHKDDEEDNRSEYSFKSRPLTAGDGIMHNGVRFFATAMSALDRIEGLLSEIEQTRTLVHQMIGEFSLVGGKLRMSPEGRTKRNACSVIKKEEKDACVPRCQKRSKPKRNKTLLEICEEMQKRNPRSMDNK